MFLPSSPPYQFRSLLESPARIPGDELERPALSSWSPLAMDNTTRRASCPCDPAAVATAKVMLLHERRGAPYSVDVLVLKTHR